MEDCCGIIEESTTHNKQDKFHDEAHLYFSNSFNEENDEGYQMDYDETIVLELAQEVSFT